MWIIEEDKDGNEVALCLICKDTLDIKGIDRDEYSNAMNAHVGSHENS